MSSRAFPCLVWGIIAITGMAIPAYAEIGKDRPRLTDAREKE